MAQPLLLIVTGRTASGKTTLARRLAGDLRLSLISKDEIKESLYDTLGASNRSESRRLGGASMSLLRIIAGSLLRAGVSVILEANFRESYDGAAMRELVTTYHPVVAQVWLTADAVSLERRVVERAARGERHPGHGELAMLEEIRRDLASPTDAPLRLPGTLLALDTTDFPESGYDAVRAYGLIAHHGAMTMDDSL